MSDTYDCDCCGLAVPTEMITHIRDHPFGDTDACPGCTGDPESTTVLALMMLADVQKLLHQYIEFCHRRDRHRRKGDDHVAAGKADRAIDRTIEHCLEIYPGVEV